MNEVTEVALLREELDALRAEVASLRTQVGRGAATAAVEPETDRRGFFKLAAGTAAGAVAATVIGAEPVAATTGQPMLIGVDPNETTAVTDVTVLQHPSSTALAPVMLQIRNDTGQIPPIGATYKAAIHAATTGSPSAGSFLRVGTVSETVGSTVNSPGIGVIGKASDPDNRPVPTEPIGVLGLAGGNGIGVQGRVGAAGATAVQALATHVGAFGVHAQNSADGVALYVDDRLIQGFPGVPGPPASGAQRFQGEYYRDGVGDLYLCIDDGDPGEWRRVVTQTTAEVSGPPPLERSKGDVHRDSAGDLFLCTADGNPASWRKVVTQHKDFANAGGSINLLSKPIRLIDTRPSSTAPITLGKVRPTSGVDTAAIDVTGVVAGGLSVPDGAKGIIGTVTAANALGIGYLSIFPGSVTFPGTSNLNFSAVAPVATGFTCALPTNGTIKLRVGGATTHVIIDVAGFLF